MDPFIISFIAGAYSIWNWCNTVDFIVNCPCTGDISFMKLLFFISVMWPSYQLPWNIYSNNRIIAQEIIKCRNMLHSPFHSVCRLFATLHTQKMQRWNSSLRIILVWTKVCLFSVQAKCRLVDITYKITRLTSFDYIIPNLHVRTTYRLRKVISSRGLCNAHY